jgi:hypothetical protein
MGKGTIGLNPFYHDGTIMSHSAMAGLLSVIISFTDARSCKSSHSSWILAWVLAWGVKSEGRDWIGTRQASTLDKVYRPDEGLEKLGIETRDSSVPPSSTPLHCTFVHCHSFVSVKPPSAVLGWLPPFSRFGLAISLCPGQPFTTPSSFLRSVVH